MTLRGRNLNGKSVDNMLHVFNENRIPYYIRLLDEDIVALYVALNFYQRLSSAKVVDEVKLSN